MTDEQHVKQGTIVCQDCGNVIEACYSPEGVKTWYGICSACQVKESH